MRCIPRPVPPIRGAGRDIHATGSPSRSSRSIPSTTHSSAPHSRRAK